MSTSRTIELICAFISLAVGFYMLTVAIRSREGIWLYLCSAASITIGWALLTNKEEDK